MVSVSRTRSITEGIGINLISGRNRGPARSMQLVLQSACIAFLLQFAKKRFSKERSKSDTECGRREGFPDYQDAPSSSREPSQGKDATPAVFPIERKCFADAYPAVAQDKKRGPDTLVR